MNVRAAPAEHFEWLTERAQCSRTGNFRAIEALDKHGRIKGMAGFDCWTESAVHIHIAVDTPIAIRWLLRPSFSYVFEEQGRSVAIGLVAAGNERALAFDKSLGFREVFRLRDGAAVGEDMVILEMRKEDCRWIGQPARKVA